MAGDFFDSRGERGGCPMWRALTRLLGVNYKVMVGGNNVTITDLVTGGFKNFRMTQYTEDYVCRETTKEVAARRPTKVRIIGLTLPQAVV